MEYSSTTQSDYLVCAPNLALAPLPGHKPARRMGASIPRLAIRYGPREHGIRYKIIQEPGGYNKILDDDISQSSSCLFSCVQGEKERGGNSSLLSSGHLQDSQGINSEISAAGRSPPGLLLHHPS